jgi:hypothetical protein
MHGSMKVEFGRYSALTENPEGMTIAFQDCKGN